MEDKWWEKIIWWNLIGMECGFESLLAYFLNET